MQGPRFSLAQAGGWITTEDIDVGGLEHGWIIFPYPLVNIQKTMENHHF